MTFLEHLDELRKRITHAVVALLVGFLAALAFGDLLEDFVYQRLTAELEGGKFIYTEPGEGFFLWIKIAALAGVLIASPYIMWQVWLFIAPGLYAREKKLAIPFVVGSSSLFVAGAAFSHYVLFPAAWRFFARFDNEYIEFTPRIDPVFGLYVKLMLGMGLVFQMPMLMLVLARLGIVSAGFLARNIKYAVLLIFVVAAVITPDGSPVSQALVAAPMFVLYLIGILVAWAFGKSNKLDDEDRRLKSLMSLTSSNSEPYHQPMSIIRGLATLVVATLVAAAPAWAQSADQETRPASSTIIGDTGLWFVPLGETLPKGKVSGMAAFVNFDRSEGFTDISDLDRNVRVRRDRPRRDLRRRRVPTPYRRRSHTGPDRQPADGLPDQGGLANRVRRHHRRREVQRPLAGHEQRRGVRRARSHEVADRELRRRTRHRFA